MRKVIRHLFFASFSIRQDLPSFPTRRSSDLLVHLGQAQLPGGAGVLDGGDGARRGTAVIAGDGDQVGVDRKSTRLNSSHVRISYAVFCLKKKKMPKPLHLKFLTNYIPNPNAL